MPGEGPRAAGKVVRWNRVQVGELAVEIQGGNRLITLQVESQLLHGANDLAEEVAAFGGRVFAGIDGRWATFTNVIALPAPKASTL